MPRGLFAPKPEGGNGGGLSRPVLIGIIAAAAVIAIALCVGGYYLLTGGILGGGTARATSTLPTNPTQVVIVVPTLAATPTSAATSTPAPTDTLVVGLTNTPPPGSRATNTRAPGAARTATPTRASASVTPAPPPGLYVTKIAIDRTIEANQKFGFRVTFFNNSGGSGHKDKWLVVVYRKKDLVEGSPERPFGNTPTKTLDVPVGTTEVLLAESYALGPSGPPDCYYQAEANYVGDNNLLVPFPSTGGKPIRFEFSFCQ
jgi:hypothetical protein